MSALALNAEALYQELLRGVRSLCRDNTRLVGITSGGAWLAQRLQRDLGLAGEAGQHVQRLLHHGALVRDFLDRDLLVAMRHEFPTRIQCGLRHARACFADFGIDG